MTRLAGALALIMCSATWAMAAPAYVTTTVNLRAGPGTSHAIVAKIPGGSLIDAGDCAQGWCAVTWQDKSGYVIKSAINLSGRIPPRPRPPVIYYGPPLIYEPPPPYFGPPVYYGPPHYYRPYWRRRWWW